MSSDKMPLDTRRVFPLRVIIQKQFPNANSGERKQTEYSPTWPGVSITIYKCMLAADTGEVKDTKVFEKLCKQKKFLPLSDQELKAAQKGELFRDYAFSFSEQIVEDYLQQISRKFLLPKISAYAKRRNLTAEESQEKDTIQELFNEGAFEKTCVYLYANAKNNWDDLQKEKIIAQLFSLRKIVCLEVFFGFDIGEYIACAKALDPKRLIARLVQHFQHCGIIAEVNNKHLEENLAAQLKDAGKNLSDTLYVSIFFGTYIEAIYKQRMIPHANYTVAIKLPNSVSASQITYDFTQRFNDFPTTKDGQASERKMLLLTKESFLKGYDFIQLLSALIRVLELSNGHQYEEAYFMALEDVLKRRVIQQTSITADEVQALKKMFLERIKDADPKTLCEVYAKQVAKTKEILVEKLYERLGDPQLKEFCRANVLLLLTEVGKSIDADIVKLEHTANSYKL